MTINSLLEDIERDMFKIIHESKPHCVHVKDLAEQLNEMNAQQTNMAKKSVRKRSKSVSDVGNSTNKVPALLSSSDFVPFDFQLLEAAEKIKEVNNLSKKVDLSEHMSSRIAIINTKWRDIRTDMQGYVINVRSQFH